MEQILDFSVISNGRLDLKISTVHLESTVYKAVDVVRGLVLDKGIKIESFLPALVFRGDEERIFQVLINLLGNAIKFSPNNSNIRILVKEETDFFTLRIFDEGPGIKEKDQERIFKRFQQVQNREINVKGTGLGLTISQGAVFAFSLPYENSLQGN